MGYISTNIFKIWIPIKQKVIRTRNVTFDDSVFYNPKELDLGEVPRKSVEKIIQAIEMPEWKEIVIKM